MKKIIIITGANKGLGKALYDILLKQEGNDIIISISRRLSEDQQKLIEAGTERFVFIPVDLSQLNDTSCLNSLNKYVHVADKIIFINNAGVVSPIGNVGQFSDEELVNSIHVNVLSPALIINYLLKVFANKPIDIINISSGAGKHPVAGWAAYCSGKAFMEMFMQTLHLQLNNSSVSKIFSIEPGIVDTAMQEKIRNSNVEGFSRYTDFVKYKSEGKLQRAETVANRILNETNLLK